MRPVSGRDIAQLVALFDDTLEAQQAEQLRGRVLRQPDLAQAHGQIARARETMEVLAHEPAPDLPYQQVEAQIRWHLAHDPAPGLVRRWWRRRPRRALAIAAVSIAGLTLAASVGTALYHRVTRGTVRTERTPTAPASVPLAPRSRSLAPDEPPGGAPAPARPPLQAATVPLHTSAESGLLMIDNVPHGAEVHLNSVVVGHARMVLRSPVGRHSIEIWRRGKLLERRSVDVRPNGTTHVVIDR